MTPFIQVVTTLPDRVSAEQLAARLLEERLAACVQISGCTALVPLAGCRQTGKKSKSAPSSRAVIFFSVVPMIRANHPHQVPEILASPVVDGGANYLDWLDQELLPPKE